MLFPWDKYEELPLSRRNTLQIFITGRCNLACPGCFARKVAKEDITLEEYKRVVDEALNKEVGQVNLIGGEPFLHLDLIKFVEYNNEVGLKTTVYTNAQAEAFLTTPYHTAFKNCKIRVSIYTNEGDLKSVDTLPKVSFPIEICFMVSKKTRLNNLLLAAYRIERDFNCKVFFISSIRELDKGDFFSDTDITMPLLWYKQIVHSFLHWYTGNMDIHISKRGVFESTKTLPDCVCRFANYLPGGKYVQCPYDLINEKYQDSYAFGKRNCQQNNTCLMSKIILRRKDAETK